jgi:3-(3-hydroxy-phenyl)propionate hydroxylase
MRRQGAYRYPQYEFRLSEEQRVGAPRRHPVVVVGAGPVGLSAALDLASHGVRVVLLDDNNTVSAGSRAICFAKRPLEIWDRLGCARDMVDKGVNWKVGRVFFRDEAVYSFDLLPESGHKLPAMINLQQYYVEQYLVEACERSALVDLRWKHRVHGVSQTPDGVSLEVETPEGVFEMQAEWLVACDGANSGLRRLVGADFTGQVFQDRFLIADVLMKADFPPERWFWFDPPFHPGQSVLLHKECDDLWRIDFQLGWQAEPEEEKKPEKVIPRIRAMLGADADFSLEWGSIYQFACRRINRFRHGRILFAGDSAHQVSPFGARGANSGVQDTDNLAWKLAFVLRGLAPEALIDSYHDERAPAADDNILHSTRATDFISPKSRASLLFRNGVLELARSAPFARALVNSGRLSTPTPYRDSPLSTADESPFAGAMSPGSNCADAPITRCGEPAWFLELLRGQFTVLVFGELRSDALRALATVSERLPVRLLCVGRDLEDSEGVLARRYDAGPGTIYLIRPDQYVAARWRVFDVEKIKAALERCLALDRAPSPDRDVVRNVASAGGASGTASTGGAARFASTGGALGSADAGRGPDLASLILDPNIQDPDGFYRELMDSQRELSDEQAASMNAKLVLLLANHIGNRAVLSEAIAKASQQTAGCGGGERSPAAPSATSHE